VNAFPTKARHCDPGLVPGEAIQGGGVKRPGLPRDLRSLAMTIVVLVAASLASAPATAREAVWASAPEAVSVTVYRDPDRGQWQVINRDWPQGFALISETRRVTLPPGESTIRFDGVSEGMIAVSAIVTGLPGGTIEKNRNADLLSPASLVDGTLGNRVTITRTNPATGAEISEDAIVRTRADGGLVLQTGSGYEAVRCSGLPEKLTFDRVPDGLSARPVFSVDTRDANGGTYEVVLTYLSWGFDWQAHYVAAFGDAGRGEAQELGLRSWLTLVNDNGQSFENAQLNVVAGELSVVSDFQSLAATPQARELFLQCYPLGSTAAGSPIPVYQDSFGWGGAADGAMVVSAQRRASSMEMSSPVTAVGAEMLAAEEQLGDLKLYRVPEPVTVASKSMKQVAFLAEDEVKGRLFYRGDCWPNGSAGTPSPMRIVLETVNDEEHGLGMALPMGGVTMFEDGLLVGEEWLRDHAEGQEVEIEVAGSTEVFATCTGPDGATPYAPNYPWVPMSMTISNANPRPVRVKLRLGPFAEWRLREELRGLTIEDGQWTLERTIPANRTETVGWTIRNFRGVTE
jgi:hypothetical protein